MRDALTRHTKEVSAIHMEQRSLSAAMTDAPTMSYEEESASGMVRRPLPKNAAMKDVPMEPSKEEFAIDMEQSEHTKYAVTRGALTTQFKEEFAIDMEQSAKDAAMRDAPMMWYREASA